MTDTNSIRCTIIAIATGSCALLTTACAPAPTALTVLHEYPPKPADSPVEIFQSAAPQCDFREIGIVTARRRTFLTSMEKVNDAMRREARKIGGDALVGVYQTRPIHNPGAFFPDRDPVLSGVVIRFTDPGCLL